MEQPGYSLKSVYATLPRTVRGMPLVLGNDPKGKNILYCAGNSVIIRDIEKPDLCDIYTEHSTSTTVAKYSPSGFYIASGDQNGKIRIWDTTQKEHILKKEYQFLSGPVRDIGWSTDNQRLAVVGEGRERFGHVFLFDTGTSNGTLSGQSKPMNSVDFRPSRPFRIATASEDYSVALFEGPPFKFKNMFTNHSRFAHCVRYNPDGSLFGSCGADGKVFIYEGTEGNLLGELIDPAGKGCAHSGGVYSLTWSPDGSKLVTCSGDKTTKLWDIASRSLLNTFSFGQEIEDQQLSCLWQGDHIVTVSLSGFLYYLDPANPSSPKRIIKGHNKPITSVAVDVDNGLIYTADSDGFICQWIANSGTCSRLEPKYHKAQVQSLYFYAGSLVSTSIDDTVAIVTGLRDKSTQIEDSTSLKVNVSTLKLPSQPRSVACRQEKSDNLIAVACQMELILLKQMNKIASIIPPAALTCVALHPVKNLLATGSEDNKVYIYEFSDNILKLIKELTHNGAITSVNFSPDGNYLAATDTARRVVPYHVSNFEIASPKEWTFHTARVDCLAWNPDSKRLASGSLDTSVIVWDVTKPSEYPLIIKGAHTMSQITGVSWLDFNTLVTVGHDGNVKQWTIV